VFDLGKGLFDRVGVRAVDGREQGPDAGRLDGDVAGTRKRREINNDTNAHAADDL